jgi:DNA-binding beta-propeller fold protein YncE
VALPAGNRPVDVTVAPAGEELLFVVNGRQNRITVLSEATGGVVTTIRAKGALAVATWGER